MEKYELIPTPSSLMESMREIGYSTETAVADLVDNCITSKANLIHVRYSWNDAKPWLAVIDDGDGMDIDGLIEAMKMGSVSPIIERDLDDLGRFGLGMKTASLSQSRSFLVLSKKDGHYSIAEWDLDSFGDDKDNKWLINIYNYKEIDSILKNLNEQYLGDCDNGTIVYWNKIDRIDVGDSPKHQESKFNEVLMSVRSHLELVFHRYLAPTLGKKKIMIKFNNHPLDAFDPFFTKKSEEMPSQEFQYGKSNIVVQPYVLPHHSRVSKEEYNYYEGKRGYLQEQGFYIYRNRRLIIYANWFRLIPKAELTKLLRVKIDIPNSLDHLWKIDVKKSNAIPPVAVRDELRKIVGKIEIRGTRVYKRRGKKLISRTTEPIWNRSIKDGQILYQINKDHTVIKDYYKSLDREQIKQADLVMSVIQSTFPREIYFSDIASEPEKTSLASLDSNQIEKLLSIFIDPSGKKPTKERLEDILRVDPFSSNIELTKQVFEKLEYEC